MGSILRTLRERRGLGVADAAALIGVTRATVYAWEGGEKEPDKPALRSACDVYAATDDERAELARLRAFGPTSADVTPAA